ncbi:alpha/beta hydrolase [Spirosoma soli]|uniref:Alpha/beta hydrolase n=1 Tax=Spirosoma soli TaxID=1770529 RepID=A0ABW5M9M9_9BACT
MPDRIFLIHGYVEDPTIFDKLVPLLPPADYVPVNLADEFLRWQPINSVDARQVAQYLTNQYKITAEDTVIGHSMGGWIGIHIKQLTGAAVVQISTWTDQEKIKFPTHNLSVLRFFLKTGLTQSRFLTSFFLKQYPFDESTELYAHLLDNANKMSRLYIWQQLQTLFAKVSPLTVQPDLRIHARADNIVAPPDETFVEVPGDHFSLVFHAELVAEPIRTIIGNRPITDIW